MEVGQERDLENYQNCRRGILTKIFNMESQNGTILSNTVCVINLIFLMIVYTCKLKYLLHKMSWMGANLITIRSEVNYWTGLGIKIPLVENCYKN